MNRTAVAAAACAAVSVFAACGSSSPPQAANVGVCGGQTGVASARTANYMVVLVVGVPENAANGSEPSGPQSPAAGSPSVNASPAATNSPSSASPTPAAGEVVLGGTMDSAAGPGATHLALHVCARTTGAVISDVHPTVRLRDESLGSPPRPLTVALMEGVGQGRNDLHYGNNVVLRPGDSYRIGVTLDPADSVDLAYQPPPAASTTQSAPPPTCIVNHSMCGGGP